MEVSRFLSALEQNGVDVSAGLARFMGNETLYLSFLCRLPQALDLAAIRCALQRGDKETFYTAVHDLKGTTGNLSVSPLFSVCCRILEEYRVQGLARPDRLEALFQELEAAAVPLIRLIHEYKGG